MKSRKRKASPEEEVSGEPQTTGENISPPTPSGITVTDKSQDGSVSTINSAEKYVENQKENGLLTSMEYEKIKVDELCRHKLFRFCKFIYRDSELKYGTKISNFVLTELGVPDCKREEFWYAHHETVRRCITKKRNNLTNELKKIFLSK
jgi:hypothetical protein